MADTFTFYNDFKEKLLNGNGIDFDLDTLKVALTTATYTPDIDTHDFFDDVTNELAASGNYTAGGEALTTVSVNQDNTNNVAYVDADDLTWTALTQSGAIKYGVLYKDTGVDSTSPLVGYITFDTAQTPNGSDFTIQWDATAGVFKLA